MHVILDSFASHEEVQDTETVLVAAGITEAQVRTQPPPPKGVGNGSTWITWLYATAPLNVFLTTLAKRLAERLAEQLAEEGTGPALRAFFMRLRESRRKSPYPDGLISIIGSDERTVLIHEWPIGAYERLLEIDWSQQQPGTYEWDPEALDWVNFGDLLQEGRHVIQRRFRRPDGS